MALADAVAIALAVAVASALAITLAIAIMLALPIPLKRSWAIRGYHNDTSVPPTSTPEQELGHTGVAFIEVSDEG